MPGSAKVASNDDEGRLSSRSNSRNLAGKREPGEAEASPSFKKPRESGPEPRTVLQAAPKHKRFRILGSMVKAMNRFKGSLNPTLNFADEHTHEKHHAVSRWERLDQNVDEKTQRKQLQAHSSFRNRGHKGQMVLAPLAAPADE
ncbi:unnamed protein product [Pedinophyceae sp. YPF-701]|nr:unnamed protein product [Pedinophyceae sp. YPF-701]